MLLIEIQTLSYMPVKYKIATKRPGLAKDDKVKYYPIITDRTTTDLRDLCKIISHRSSFNAADVVGVVQSLIELIPELLQDGNKVKLDGFGIFSLHASGTGKENPDDVTSEDITGVKMSFLPDKYIKKQLKTTEFVKK